MSATAYVGLGANLFDRAATLREAVRRIGALPRTSVTRVSSLWETRPVGGPPGQPDFLNAAAALGTALEPEALMEALLEIERALGRARGPERNGPRAIDLDLLLYGSLVLRGPRPPIVPHPRLAERAFVLAPLAEIAGDLALPGGSGDTVRSLLARMDVSGVRVFGPSLSQASSQRGAASRISR